MSSAPLRRRRSKTLPGVVLAISLIAATAPSRSDELADFHAAVTEATAYYRVAMSTLETGGREETSASVHRFRASWQALVDRFSKHRPEPFTDEEQFSAMVTLTDSRLVGALIVIDIGSREAARSALAPIGETLADLSARSE
ncbi:MAG: hypothetical protein IT537_21785 [Hyphomicrobiales bacterium]|nr:hypothetical protein [Hyphomicrobiales bacterium]